MAGLNNFWTDPEIVSFVLRHPEFLRSLIFLTVCVMPLMILSYIHWFLWGKRTSQLPWWLPSVRSWGEGIWQWGISFIGLAIPFKAIAIFAKQSSEWGVTLTGNPFLVLHLKPDLIETLAALTLIFWFLFMGEAHLARRRITNWWNSPERLRWFRWSKKSTAKKVQPGQSVKKHFPLTVDEELELLKQQLNKKPLSQGVNEE
jgi:hypothetical protein